MNEALAEPLSWAQAEFGHARLNDVRNQSRLIQMAAGLAEHPHATVARVYPIPAAQQGAYDFLENSRITPAALVRASAEATAARAAQQNLVLLPADGCCLTLRDPYDVRGTGSVGEHTHGARGLQVLDAIALRNDGVPLGLAGLVTWARSHRRHATSHKVRSVTEKETIHWLELRAQIRATFTEQALNTTRVFLHDSGADAWPILLDVIAHDVQDGEFSVIRAAHNRRVFTDSNVPSYLWDQLGKADLHTRYRQKIPAGHGRSARRALLEIHATKVTLDLQLLPTKEHETVTLWAVRVRERGRLPAGEERLEWVLLTSWPVETLDAARQVIAWYVFRWRVEDHHKTWKKSGSNIEATALRSRSAIEKWMALHAAVSARALQLTYLARQPKEGAAPATTVFANEELAALRAMRAANGLPTPDQPTVEQAVVLVAGLGGYVPMRGRCPGPKVLRRGLEELAIATQALRGAKLTKRRTKQRPN